MRLLLVLLVANLGVATALPAQDRRVALLIGNSEYEVPQLRLRNPARDVALLATALGEFGFDVATLTDVDRATMERALDQFAAQASGADVALIYFAGHAVQVESQNYLIGTRFADPTVTGLLAESLTAARLADALRTSGAGLGLVLLDACRDNPLDFGGLSDGLAVPQGSTRLLFAYATDPGNVASDGMGDNSPFAEAFVEHLPTPGLEIRILFGRVRQAVILATDGAQVPWVEEAVLGEYYLAGRDAPRIGGNEEIMAWRDLGSAPTTEQLQVYIERYPDGPLTPTARTWLDLRTAPAGETPVAFDADTLLAQAEADRVASALGVLGFLQVSRGTGGPGTDVKAALSDFARANPKLQLTSLDPLYTEAAQVATFLAASVSQQIRTDLVALEAIERLTKLSAADYELMGSIATDSPADQAILREAEVALADMAERRERLLERLDEARSYYAWLVESAATGFGDYVDGQTIGPGGGRSLTVVPQVAEDGRLFSENVAMARSLPRGSLAWMRGFLPDQD